MNERIVELMRSKGLHKNISEDCQHRMELLAELVINECAQACISMGNDYEIKSAGQYQAELFAFAIKKHFGLEQ
jgi:hypothetical protein